MQALIYIVEDDMNIQEIEMFALKNTGYVTEGFANAKSFFSRMTEKIPDLILLDIMLPDQDGLEIVRKLRERPETVRVPIILVTAKTTELDKVKGLDIGADDYPEKLKNIYAFLSLSISILLINLYKYILSIFSNFKKFSINSSNSFSSFVLYFVLIFSSVPISFCSNSSFCFIKFVLSNINFCDTLM